jgi:zinc D-Ala-D-Ala carboxypeptidase
MNLTPHFTLEELTASQSAARLGLDNTPPPEMLATLKRTAQLLEEVRALLGKPVLVSSGYRAPAVNRAVGGAQNSAHMLGCAADFSCPSFGSPLDICRAIVRSDIAFDQVIHEFRAWVHIAWAPSPRKMVLTIDAAGTRLGLS